MSTHVVVIASDLRRATIKVTPGTYLIDVLHEACKKLGISSDQYLLKNKQKTVDLTVPFRTSGLVGGVKLELVRTSKTPSAVQIALQLPQPEAKEIPGGRLISKFPSDLTLWGVLRQFESGANAGRNVNITARGVAKTTAGLATGAGQLFYEKPVLNIMGRDYTSFADFQKTLAQLGLNSGSVLIRLTFRTSEQTLFEAMEEISSFFRETSTDSVPGVQTQPQPQPQPAPAEEEDKATAAATTLEETTSSQVTDTDTPITNVHPSSTDAKEETRENKEAGPNSETRDPLEPVGVFLAPATSTPAAAAAAPPHDDDFTPTIAHAKLHQSQLQQRARNKRLLSDRELEGARASEQARLDAVRSVLVKVRFPDNTSGDWQLGPAATGAFLYAAVRHVMADPALPFHLVLPGSGSGSGSGGGVGVCVLKDNDDAPRHALIAGYKLRGRVLLNLVWDDEVPLARRGRPFLKEHVVAAQGQAIKVPAMMVGDDDDAHGGGLVGAGKSAAVVEEQGDEAESGRKTDGNRGAKVPKWLKLGKK